jgi:hypothetical protein
LREAHFRDLINLGNLEAGLIMVMARRPRPATAALAAIRQQDKLNKSGFDIEDAVTNYVRWFFGQTISKTLLNNLSATLKDLGIDDTNLEQFAHVFARHILSHAEWNVDPKKLANFGQTQFATIMKGKTLGQMIAYLVGMVTSAQQGRKKAQK